MADKTLSCKDCNSEFIFTEERAFYQVPDLRTSPRDAQIAEGQEKMERNNRNRSFGGGNRW